MSRASTERQQYSMEFQKEVLETSKFTEEQVRKMLAHFLENSSTYEMDAALKTVSMEQSDLGW